MGYIHILTPEQISRLPAEYVAKILEQEAEQALRSRIRSNLRKLDAEALNTLDDKAVGMACKLFMLTREEDDIPPPEGMTDEAWIAYNLLCELVFDDWSEDDGR